MPGCRLDPQSGARRRPPVRDSLIGDVSPAPSPFLSGIMEIHFKKEELAAGGRFAARLLRGRCRCLGALGQSGVTSRFRLKVKFSTEPGTRGSLTMHLPPRVPCLSHFQGQGKRDLPPPPPPPPACPVPRLGRHGARLARALGFRG